MTRRSTRIATTGPATGTRSAAKPARRRRGPLRSLAVYGIIGALVLGVAIPAYSALQQPAQARTIQQVANADAQELVVASGATQAPLSRDSYSATTGDSIAKAKAEAAAAARAKAAAKVQTASYSTSSTSSTVTFAPGSGTFRWPLTHVDHLGDGFMARGGEHMGVDLLDPARTPIYAATDGVVKVSSESYYGYGVAVVISSSAGGKSLDTVYGHMTYGSRVVSVGQSVKAGQLIGLVGSTGRSTANHLHFEVHINGTPIDPYQWLLANVGPMP
ncbi:M23 family metallopeptidase [Microbacterium mangrovi]|uniref:M23 family metallopeptidase n=1 Tax=Microbacterium mangrovi TaxID=1348253 RepID=UPI000AF1B540|nr:M23 family metallopeptidase [Microbacterium mangrovi]